MKALAESPCDFDGTELFVDGFMLRDDAPMSHSDHGYDSRIDWWGVSVTAGRVICDEKRDY